MSSLNEIGFKLLDNESLRNRFETRLNEVGYSLTSAAPETRLISDYEVNLVPLNAGPSFVVRLTQDWSQEWTEGVLLSNPSLQPLEIFSFDRTKRYPVSCYDAWIENIVDAVRRYSLPDST